MGGIESGASSIFLFFLEKELAVDVAHMEEVLVSIVSTAGALVVITV